MSLLDRLPVRRRLIRVDEGTPKQSDMVLALMALSGDELSWWSLRIVETGHGRHRAIGKNKSRVLLLRRLRVMQNGSRRNAPQMSTPRSQNSRNEVNDECGDCLRNGAGSVLPSLRAHLQMFPCELRQENGALTCALFHGGR